MITGRGEEIGKKWRTPITTGRGAEIGKPRMKDTNIIRQEVLRKESWIETLSCDN
jgi:hypothetical protein